MKSIYKILFSLFILSNSLIIFAQTYSGKIIKVIDGDTFVFQAAEGNLKIRMLAIDAPEHDQPAGQESKAFLATFENKAGILKAESVDKYGRTLAYLFIDNQNINLLCVRNGHAWHYKQYNKDEAFAQAEKQAKAEKLGLWKEPDPIPPWNWRKVH